MVEGQPLDDGLASAILALMTPPASATSTIGVGGVSSSASTPLMSVIMEVSSSVSTLDSHVSTPPFSLTVTAYKADFVTPTRRSGRYGAAMDGASATDEDSMMRAMRRKAELNLDYSGIISPSKSNFFYPFRHI
jgi:hypothetical protein